MRDARTFSRRTFLNPTPRAIYCLAGLFFCVAAAALIDAGDRGRDHAAYIAAARKYLDECRRAAELLAKAPASRQYKRGLDAVFAARNLMPAAPRAIDPHGVIGFLLRELILQFEAARPAVDQRSAPRCQRAAEQQRKRIALAERALDRAEKLEQADGRRGKANCKLAQAELLLFLNPEPS